MECVSQRLRVILSRNITLLPWIGKEPRTKPMSLSSLQQSRVMVVRATRVIVEDNEELDR